MQITYLGRHFEVTEALKNYAADKISRLENRMKNITSVQVIFQIENVKHIAEANVHIAKHEIHAKAEASDMYAAIDELVDKLTKQLTKLKDKMTDHR